jgi:hypothetical protein
VIYVWKLPEEVSKLLVKKKVIVGELDSIDEDEMEDSVKRGGSSARENPFDKSNNTNNVKNELDDIFAQIGQVNGKIKNMEEEKKFEGPKSIGESEQESINFGDKGNKLPRWAQSIYGDAPDLNQ